MPGWYVHMQAAHDTAERLRTGTVPAGYPISTAEAQTLGEACRTWRNYLALGALGPDLFYLLPDFADTKGCVIRQVVQWAFDVWDVIDHEFVGKWERWIDPISTNSQQLSSQLTGGLSNQLAQVLDELSAAAVAAFESLLPHLGDWFGVLTSGVPQGYGEDGFYWSDVFHYRRTYQFPFVLYSRARQARDAATTDEERNDADARMAFAVGWMTHCATDVTGHPFTNAKCGGPYRDHWQRHHLVENHFDSQNYAAVNGGMPWYAEYGTSALHFWVAFRRRGDAPYTGRADGPAYDYFTGLPAYTTAAGPGPAAARRAFFDLDSGELPDHLVDALLDAMAAVHPLGPKILTIDPRYSASTGGQPDGRPNSDAMAQMWDIAYSYLKMTASDGFSPTRPSPPGVFTDHSFPAPPGGNYGVDGDPARGADVDGDSFTLLDLLLAIIAWAVYLAEVVVWLVTVLPALITDIATFPAREAVYYAAVVPAWNLYLLARRALVMAGFLMPKPEEVDPGLTTLGSSDGTFSVASALDDPMGSGVPVSAVTEPSGRSGTTAAYGIDPAYPRNIVRDKASTVPGPDLVAALGLTGRLVYAGDAGVTSKPSEWVAPWRYPLKNLAGDWVPQEGAPVHVGPYVVGDTSTVLLASLAGDDKARQRLEECASPGETAKALDELLPLDAHLGGPVDYGVYLVGRMVAERAEPEFGVPDFNLDSDRGYAWHCWDWDRHNLGRDPAHPGDRGRWECVPDHIPTGQTDFSYPQPCTPPQLFHAGHDNPRQADASGTPLDPQWYDPRRDLKVHYLTRTPPPAPDPFGADPCGQGDPPHDPNPGVWPADDTGGDR